RLAEPRSAPKTYTTLPLGPNSAFPYSDERTLNRAAALGFACAEAATATTVTATTAIAPNPSLTIRNPFPIRTPFHPECPIGIRKSATPHQEIQTRRTLRMRPQPPPRWRSPGVQVVNGAWLFGYNRPLLHSPGLG